ncbi:hypothetical protein A2Z23_02070 [Candidatus Curtissbacteria bacterium RBG_16_39_7]|uniref:Uncharacterized protein n=1 Tax=Candidatus Curtissbacteria bacterium RBG_16_39_7 TaxID=1797707 RepID=A0A1F5G1X5_9BACT|nr:MAG: hypothetical protein A2Z23_02070 [Candidatus Curtissbacteria bacterium RBG_16_39_7]
MEKELSSESQPKIFRVEFYHDPNFIPYWYSKGQLDLEAQKNKNHPAMYAAMMSDEWNSLISPIISPEMRKVLGVWDIFEPFTCYVLEHRIQIKENEFIEASSHPLAIWAKPAHPKWRYLPFHSRVIHELVHCVGPNYSPIWGLLEDETASIHRDNLEFWFWDPQYGSLREELVVRHATHLVTKEVFGQEFADWFLGQESKLIPVSSC